MNYDAMNDMFKWMYYSTYHPSTDTTIVLADYRANKPILQVLEEQGINVDIYFRKLKIEKVNDVRKSEE